MRRNSCHGVNQRASCSGKGVETVGCVPERHVARIPFDLPDWGCRRRPLILTHGTVGRNQCFAARPRERLVLDTGWSANFSTVRQRSVAVCLSAEGIRPAGRSERRAVRAHGPAAGLPTLGWYRRLIRRVCCLTTHSGAKPVPNPQGAFFGAGRWPQHRHESSPRQDIRIRGLSRLGTRLAPCAWRLGRTHTRPQLLAKNLLLGDPQSIATRTRQGVELGFSVQAQFDIVRGAAATLRGSDPRGRETAL